MRVRHISGVLMLAAAVAMHHVAVSARNFTGALWPAQETSGLPKMALANASCGIEPVPPRTSPLVNGYTIEYNEYRVRHGLAADFDFVAVSEEFCQLLTVNPADSPACGNICNTRSVSSTFPPSHLFDGDLSSRWQGPILTENVIIDFNLDGVCHHSSTPLVST